MKRFLLGLALGMLCTGAPAIGNPTVLPVANADWLVSESGNGSLSVRDRRSGESTIERLESEICDLELCPDCSFLSYRTHCAPGSRADSELVILDLETRKRTSGHALRLEPGERRWDPSGGHGFFRQENILWLVPNHEIGRFLEALGKGEAPEVGLRIEGHPSGFIWQEAWLGGGLLVFGTGVGEMACWGLADPNRGSVDLLTCCGVRTKHGFPTECAGAVADPWPLFEAEGVFGADREWQEMGRLFYKGVRRFLGLEGGSGN